MSKVRIYEAAKQLNVDPKAAVALFQAIGVGDVRNHMSSVEQEAIERVKRHLEKQKTHDVVEERVRGDGRVIKRRAIAKPGAPAPVAAPESQSAQSAHAQPRSTPQIPLAPPSVPRARVSEKAIVEAPAAQTDAGRNGHAVHAEEIPPAAPSERNKSTRELKSTRDVNAPSERHAPRDVPSSRKVQTEDVSAPAQAAEPEAPPAESHAHAPAVFEQAAPVAAAPPPPPSAAKPVFEEAPPVAAAPPPPPPPVVREPDPPPPPPQRSQRTGVEYWTGRPGVPMPTPASAQRTAIGGGPASSMPRRVQYDPRAGSGPARGMRPGGPMRPMMGRGPGGRRMMNRSEMGSTGPRKPGGSTQEMSAHKKVVRIEENITLSSMAAKMSLKSTELLMKLLGMGMTGVHINSTLDADTAKILASEFGWEVEDTAVSEEASLAAARTSDEKPDEADTDANIVVRAPVVTVMGHVDHGKTSLLDKIRKAKVAEGEAGGITQHIGAYKVLTDHGTIVFLDTPGHEAFTAMRARGAGATDLVVLVVAADDGVMPQTKEAIAHAKAADVPIIVAVNKIDKQGAEPERVKRELAELQLVPEEWGGDTMFVSVSALTGEGIPELLERISLQAEVMELKANPSLPASGTVLEALLDRGRGAVARVLVQDGTLRTGDFVLAGPGFGKVRAMTNEHGKNIAEAGPSTPVEILGLAEVPGAGDPLHVVLDPKKAQEIAETRKGKLAKSLIPVDARASLEGIIDRLKDSDMLELRIIIKGDVQGSVEAVGSALARLTTDRVKLAIIHAGVGAITEGDVNLAIASKAIIIGFNVRPAGKAASLAEENEIEIRLYNIIYNAVDDVRLAMEGLLPATLVEKTNGKAEVRQLFKIKGTVIAGSYVTQGKFTRGSQVRVLRDNNVLFVGKVSSLRHLKDDVKEVPEGMECGITVDGFTELKEKDILESYEVEAVKQKL